MSNGWACEAVDVRQQDYTDCTRDAECLLVPTSCCGFCGTVTLDRAYAVNPEAEAEFLSCPADVGCAAIEAQPRSSGSAERIKRGNLGAAAFCADPFGNGFCLRAIQP